MAAPVTGRSAGTCWIRRTAAVLGGFGTGRSPLMSSRRSGRSSTASRATPRRATTFDGDGVAWDIWKTFYGRERATADPSARGSPGPLDRWMATRLVRLFPVVVALYEKVKARHRPLDQLDLLVKLRDLLRQRPRRARRVPGDVRPRLRGRVPGHGPASGGDRPLPLRARRRWPPRWEDVRARARARSRSSATPSSRSIASGGRTSRCTTASAGRRRRQTALEVTARRPTSGACRR